MDRFDHWFSYGVIPVSTFLIAFFAWTLLSY
jgi:hypothetical protein